MSFRDGFLALLGAFVYCAPVWWIIATHNATGPAWTVKGTLQALAGIWAFTTIFVGPFGILVFLFGVSSLFKAKPAERNVRDHPRIDRRMTTPTWRRQF